MDESQNPTSRPQSAPPERFDSGLQAAGHYRIAAEPSQLAHDLGLAQRAAESGDLVRAAHRLGLKARVDEAGNQVYPFGIYHAWRGYF